MASSTGSADNQDATTLIDAVVAENYAAVQDCISNAGGRDVTVVAVTKAFEAHFIDSAVRCGIGHIGESYAQECLAKMGGITVGSLPQVHFIGRLQRNKVKRLAHCVDVWQSIDRSSLVDEVERRAPGTDVMIQVNIAGAESQGGCAPADVEILASHVSKTSLKLVGLMAIGPRGSVEESRSSFRELRQMTDLLGLPHCSMGMSSDMEVAVGEGATMVRVGRSLFGPRL